MGDYRIRVLPFEFVAINFIPFHLDRLDSLTPSHVRPRVNFSFNVLANECDTRKCEGEGTVVDRIEKKGTQEADAD